MITRRSILAPFVAAIMIAAPIALTAPPAIAAPAGGSLTTSILQTLPGGTFVGTLTTTGFKYAAGVISAVGTLNGTFTDTTGAVTNITNLPVTVPLTSFTGTCTILTLHTGAISLSALGLNVSLSPIDLVITATAAPGNLLGNLLCSVAHLLDSNGSLTAVTALLNQILGAIRL
ncbi:MAG TPA: hypothetical protein VFA04_12910 [Bryobacteraceae bacterium]|jgi:hypothetical protein|nr:hypothetical protein [Bryobacteraceae bacterium]